MREIPDGYDAENCCIFIPNNEVRAEYVNAITVSDWGEVSKALKNSADTLKAIWQKCPEKVANGISGGAF